jgi:serine phosphatase RsbU (regulator of sigma subunit)/ligand-binding sensor domain-containing protein
MKMYQKVINTLLLILINTLVFAQPESIRMPFIKNFSHEDYNSSAQNWDIVQDNRGVMYFGNSSAILEYDGHNWRQIFVPNKSTVYSLCKDNNGRIYAGAKNELGYIKSDSSGQMQYFSILDKLPKEYQTFSFIKNIMVTADNEVIFVSSVSLFIYKDQKFSVINTKTQKNRFLNIFKINNKIYVDEKGIGIWEYKNATLVLLKGTEELKDLTVTAMFPMLNGDIQIVAFNEGSFIYQKGKIEKSKNSPMLADIYSYTQAPNGDFILGLFTKGILIVDKNLNIKKYINDTRGLKNNEVRKTYIDRNGNVWLALNNGISIIYDNPYAYFGSNIGLTMTVNTAAYFEGKIFTGSSLGVYSMDVNKTPLEELKFDKISVDTKNAFDVWQIDTVNNYLICAGASGLFTIKNNRANYISEGVSVKKFITLSKQKGTILAATGTGLSLYRLTKNGWKHASDIKNFSQVCRHLEEDADGTIWITDKSKGVYHVKLNETLDSAITVDFFDISNGLPDNLGNYVFKVNQKITFGTIAGFYKFISSQKKFVKDEQMNTLFGGEIAVVALSEYSNGDLLYKEEVTNKRLNKTEWILSLLKKNADKYESLKVPFLKLKNNIFCFERIVNDQIIVGTEKGFVLYDMSAPKDFSTPYPAIIRHVEFVANDSVLYGGTFFDESGNATMIQTTNQIDAIKYEYRDLRFSYSTLFYEESDKNVYKYFLEGYDKTWSEWTSKTEKEYTNLSPGMYIFQVKARNIYGVESTVATYSFEVTPPWYLTIWAYFLYFLLGILLIWGIVQLSIRRVKHQKEVLEHIVEERTATIQTKNKELEEQKLEIEIRNHKLFEQNELIEKKNKDITASITYAKRIQEAMLPLEETIRKSLSDYFIVFRPRDIVSGDFYWFAQKSGKIVFTAVDCTGHGVPGAFMSMIGSEVLTTLTNKNILESNAILDKMNEYVVRALKQDATENQDGMDIALCVIDKEKKTLEYSGAKNPLVYIQNNELFQIKADKQSVGGYQSGKTFTKNVVNYQSPTWFYIFTDGIQDQFGGQFERKFMIKRLKELLFENHQKTPAEQKAILDKAIVDWMKNHEQTDDILLIGFML